MTSAEQASDNSSHTNPLTGLHSTAWLLDCLAKQQKKYGNIRGALICCQIQSITSIQTSFGHEQELRIIAEYGEWLKSHCPDNAFLAATFDSQVFIYLPTSSKRNLEVLAYKLADQSLSVTLVSNQIPIVLASNIGGAYIDDLPIQDPANCLRAALAALKGCQLERSGYQLFEPEKHKNLEVRAVIARDLTAALHSNHIYFALQPQFNIETQCLEGAEMLMRWNHLQYGALNAQTVVDVAESTQQILRLGQHALETAFDHLRRWDELGWLPKGFRLAVNVSAAELETSSYIDNLSALFVKNEGLTKYLEMEITESLSLGDLNAIKPKLERLKAWGIQIALDDFGTAHANLHHLTALNVSTVKLDRSFINNASCNPRAAAVCEWVPKLANQLGIRVVAEGVETQDQLSLARESGASVIQGYLLAEPMGVSDFEALLINQLDTNSLIPSEQLPLISA